MASEKETKRPTVSSKSRRPLHNFKFPPLTWGTNHPNPLGFRKHSNSARTESPQRDTPFRPAYPSNDHGSNSFIAVSSSFHDSSDHGIVGSKKNISDERGRNELRFHTKKCSEGKNDRDSDAVAARTCDRNLNSLEDAVENPKIRDLKPRKVEFKKSVGNVDENPLGFHKHYDYAQTESPQRDTASRLVSPSKGYGSRMVNKGRPVAVSSSFHASSDHGIVGSKKNISDERGRNVLGFHTKKCSEGKNDRDSHAVAVRTGCWNLNFVEDADENPKRRDLKPRKVEFNKSVGHYDYARTESPQPDTPSRLVPPSKDYGSRMINEGRPVAVSSSFHASSDHGIVGSKKNISDKRGRYVPRFRTKKCGDDKNNRDSDAVAARTRDRNLNSVEDAVENQNIRDLKPGKVEFKKSVGNVDENPLDFRKHYDYARIESPQRDTPSRLVSPSKDYGSRVVNEGRPVAVSSSFHASSDHRIVGSKNNISNERGRNVPHFRTKKCGDDKNGKDSDAVAARTRYRNLNSVEDAVENQNIRDLRQREVGLKKSVGNVKADGGVSRIVGAVQRVNQEKSSLVESTRSRTKPKENTNTKFSVALKKEEIEADFIAMTGSKPSRRPRKRTKRLQRQLDSSFPGLRLDTITTSSYEVSDKPKMGRRR